MTSRTWMLAVVAGIGLDLSAQRDVCAAEVPRAVFLATSHDFGTVKQGEKVVHAFEVRNDGTAPLTIQGVDFSAPGLTARFPRVLRPRHQGRITLEWSTDRVRNDVRAEAIVHLDDVAQPRTTLALKGVVQPSLEVFPYAAAFFSVFKGESAERRLRVVNNEERPLGIARLELEGEHFTASFAVIEPGKVYELSVSVPSEVPPGRYREAVYLHTDHPTYPRLRIAVNVLVKADLYLSQDVVEFGEVRLDHLTKEPRLLDLLTQTILLKQRQGMFRIQSIEADVPMLQITQSPDGASQIFRIDVGLARERLQAGPLSGSIRIKTDDKAFPEFVVRVQGELK